MSRPYRFSGSQTGSRDSSPSPSLREALSQIWGPVRSAGEMTFSYFTLDCPRTVAANSADGRLIANLIIRADGKMRIIFHTEDPALENATVCFDVRILEPDAADPVPLAEGRVNLSPRQGHCPIVSPRELKRGDKLSVRFAALDQ
jgi:hypothetical protein